MKVYQELTLLPNETEDVPLFFLWSRLYQLLHVVWVEAKDERGKVSTGVSFPQYDYDLKQLGSKLRIFAPSENQIKALQLSKLFSRMNDYVHITSVRDVPESTHGYALFKRQQTKSSVERIARRSAKHRGIPLNESMESFRNKSQVYSQAPFIHMKSRSSRKNFRLMITREQVNQENYENGFSTYGLSSDESKSTVPLF